MRSASTWASRWSQRLGRRRRYVRIYHPALGSNGVCFVCRPYCASRGQLRHAIRPSYTPGEAQGNMQCDAVVGRLYYRHCCVAAITERCLTLVAAAGGQHASSRAACRAHGSGSGRGGGQRAWPGRRRRLWAPTTGGSCRRRRRRRGRPSRRRRHRSGPPSSPGQPQKVVSRKIGVLGQQMM